MDAFVLARPIARGICLFFWLAAGANILLWQSGILTTFPTTFVVLAAVGSIPAVIFGKSPAHTVEQTGGGTTSILQLELDSCKGCGCCEGYCLLVGSHGKECRAGTDGLLWATADGKAACEECGAVVPRPDDFRLCGPCVDCGFPKKCIECKRDIASPADEATCYNLSDGEGALCDECGDHECEGP